MSIAKHGFLDKAKNALDKATNILDLISNNPSIIGSDSCDNYLEQIKERTKKISNSVNSAFEAKTPKKLSNALNDYSQCFTSASQEFDEILNDINTNLNNS